MTDEEIGRLKAKKEEVTAQLASTDISRYRLNVVDPRLEDYCRTVAEHPAEHNLWEQLAVARFHGMGRR